MQITNSKSLKFGNLTCIDIGYTKNEDAIHAYGISAKGDNQFSIKFYTQGQRLYYQVNSIGGYVYFIGANVDVSVVTLPEGAVEVTIG